MKLQVNDKEIIVCGSSYSVIFKPFQRTFSYYRKGILLYSGVLDVLFDTIDSKDIESQNVSYSYTQTEKDIFISFEIDNGEKIRKQLDFSFQSEYFSAHSTIEGLSSRLTDIRFFPSSDSHRVSKEYTFIVPRFDWFVGKVERNADEDDILSCQQWLSPPPFCYIYTAKETYSAIGVASPKGRQNYSTFIHSGKDDSFILQYEGHTRITGAFTSPSLVFCPEANTWDNALREYREVLETEGYLLRPTKKNIHSWWKEPIFCGWG